MAGKKFKKVMKEYGEGQLHSSSKKGPAVKTLSQAKAIAFSEQRKSDTATKKTKKGK
jgi:hypothetical protein